MNALERRYRRLLAFYPRAFRRDHGEEMLAVLMDSASEGQRRPRLADSVNLLRNALWMRGRHGADWELTHHPRACLTVRLLSGVWLLILTGILCGYGRWWGLALVPFAVLHFWLALRLGRFINRGREADGPPPPGLGVS